MKIYETENFILESKEKPEISREEGGHIVISPKREIKDRTELIPKEAVELMRFTIISGKAFKSAMGKQGVEISRINYQENGNWNPRLHIHLYGRAKDAKSQKFGEPFAPGNKPGYKQLTQDDVELIRFEIEELFKREEFNDKKWGLKNN